MAFEDAGALAPAWMEGSLGAGASSADAEVPADDGGAGPDPVRRLTAWVSSPNIAGDIDDAALGNLGQRVVREYEIDQQSRAEWLEKTKRALEVSIPRQSRGL
jgi:hypothetical protein